MALPLLAALQLLPGAFKVGKELFDSFNGTEDDPTPSAAVSSPEELMERVEAMPPDRRAQMLAALANKVETIRAETERIVAEQGRADAETFASLPPETAGRVAVMRMTTRPMIARGAFFGVIMIPAYVLFFDGAGIFVNWLLDVFHWLFAAKDAAAPPRWPMIAREFVVEGSAYATLYQWGAGSCTAIVTTYFGLREYGKRKGNGDQPITDLVSGVGRLVRGLRK